MHQMEREDRLNVFSRTHLTLGLFIHAVKFLRYRGANKDLYSHQEKAMIDMQIPNAASISLAACDMMRSNSSGLSAVKVGQETEVSHELANREEQSSNPTGF